MTNVSSISNQSSTASLPSQTPHASWASLLDLLRRLAQELNVASTKQASDASKMAALAGASAASSQEAAGAQDKTLALFEISSSVGMMAGSLTSMGLGIKASAKSTEAHNLAMDEAKVEHALNRPRAAVGGAGAADGGIAIGIDRPHDVIKTAARNNPFLSFEGARGVPEQEANMIRAQRELAADKKQARADAASLKQGCDSLNTGLQGIGNLVKNSGEAVFRQAKAHEEALVTLNNTMKETQGAINQTARSAVQLAEQLAQTVESTRAEITRTLNSRA